MSIADMIFVVAVFLAATVVIIISLNSK